MNRDTIIKYIMGTASKDEIEAIEKRMAKDATFTERVAALEKQMLQDPKIAAKMPQNDAKKVFQHKQQVELKQFFGGLRLKLEQQLNTDSPTSNPLEEIVQYSIEQLKQWFMPLPLYEKRILGVSRGGGDVLIAPEKNMTCHNRRLEFVWEAKKGGFEEIDLIVENNRMEVLLEETLDVEMNNYMLLLPKEEFPPGRYYWKFCVEEEEPIMGMFFVEKGLMPNE